MIMLLVYHVKKEQYSQNVYSGVDCQGNLNTFFCFLQIEMNSLEFLDFLLPYLFSHLELDTFNRVPAGTQQPAMQFC